MKAKNENKNEKNCNKQRNQKNEKNCNKQSNSNESTR